MMRFLQRKCGYVLKQRSFLLMQRFCGSYEGDGKTTVTVLNKELDSGIMIDGYSQYGFRLNNGMTVIGPVAVFPRSVLSWNIEDTNSISEETLSLFSILEPKIDILVIGVGSRAIDIPFSKYILSFMRKHNINVELLPTEQACSTFNFLNGEGRCVAAALIPPDNIKTTDDELLQSKIRYENIYGEAV